MQLILQLIRASLSRQKNAQFCENEPFIVKISVISQLQIFPENGEYFFDYSHRYANPFFGPDCRTSLDGKPRSHDGVDIAFCSNLDSCTTTRPIVASACGKVEDIRYFKCKCDTTYKNLNSNIDTVITCKGNYGLTLLVYYPELGDSGATFFYAHLDRVLV